MACSIRDTPAVGTILTGTPTWVSRGVCSCPSQWGLQVSALGLLVTAVTILFMPEDRVVFGVLICIGACMLLTAALEKVVQRKGPQDSSLQRNGLQDTACRKACFGKRIEFAGLLISAALFFLTRNVNIGFLGFEKLCLAALPSGLYRNLFTAFLGFPAPDFFSTDYFSLIPWWFLYLCGYFLYGVWKGSAESGKALRGETAGLAAIPAWIGRHALLVYVLHQPLLMLFFTVGTKLLHT